MTKETASRHIQAFFRGEPPFERVKGMVGHASSEIPEVFIGWFSVMPEEQRVIFEVLIASITSEDQVLDDLPKACYLMIALAARFPMSVPQSSVQSVERLLRQGRMVRIWLNDEDTDYDDQKEFRSRWRFALALWNLLWIVGSPVADEVFLVFTENAKDP